MTEKILPVKLPNDVIAYKPFDASRLSILLAQEPVCKEMYENFLHFRIEKKENNGNIDLDCHFNEEFSSIGVKKVPIDLLRDLQVDFIRFCKTSLDQDFYLFMPIDTSEISNYTSYQKYRVPHHIFLYGYNDEKRVFYCSEFFSFSSAPYSAQTVRYEELEAAFYQLQAQQKENVMGNEWAQWMKDVQLLHSFTEYMDKFSVNRLVVGLEHYLNERDCYGNKDYLPGVSYGFAIYDLLMEYVKGVSVKSQSGLDVRGPSLLFFRFRYMKLQVKFLQETYPDFAESLEPFVLLYAKLESESRSLLSLAMKFQIDRKEKILTRLSEKTRQLKQNDWAVTKDYIECLKRL